MELREKVDLPQRAQIPFKIMWTLEYGGNGEVSLIPPDDTQFSDSVSFIRSLDISPEDIWTEKQDTPGLKRRFFGGIHQLMQPQLLLGGLGKLSLEVALQMKQTPGMVIGEFHDLPGGQTYIITEEDRERIFTSGKNAYREEISVYLAQQGLKTVEDKP